MTKLSKINDQLMGLSLTELNQVLDMVYDIKTLKAKSVLTVGANVFVVQKTWKTGLEKVWERGWNNSTGVVPSICNILLPFNLHFFILILQ